MKSQSFDFTITIRASLAAVADFHHDARALKRLTPPPIFVQLHRVEPLAEGSIVDFTLWFDPPCLCAGWPFTPTWTLGVASPIRYTRAGR